MAIVRVIVWDEQNFLQRISEPEDTFLIEAIDASGSDANVLKIGALSASNVYVGRDGIGTFVSGVLSGTFITGTFYGDGSQLRGVVTSLSSLTGSIVFVAGPGMTIVSGSGQIVLSASISGASVTSLNGFTGDITLLSSSDFLKINSGSNQIVFTASHRPIDQLVHNIAENSYEEFTYNGAQILSATVYTDSTKTTKIREENFIYNVAFMIATSSLIQCNSAGVEIERLTQKYTYSGNTIISITGTLT